MRKVPAARRAGGMRAPAASPAAAGPPRASPSPATAAPRFGQLLRLALESVGVRYVSVDVLRKAKRNSLSQRESWELWKLLHDVVMLVLADFDVDFEEMARLNSGPELDEALSDPEMHRVRVELVRFYMHEWGFLCSAFYAPQSDPSGQVLLLAFAWLVAYSKLLERRHQSIVEVGQDCFTTQRSNICDELTWCINAAQNYLGITHAQLPPFANDVVLNDQLVADAVTEATRDFPDPLRRASQAQSSSFEDQIHQLHSAHGRLQHSVSELLAFHRYHQRMLLRLERLQGKSIAATATDGSGKCEDDDEPIPASILQLLAQPKAQLDAQLRVVACSLQMLDDEIMFYKWINGVVTSLANSSGDNTNINDGVATPLMLDAKLEEQRQTIDSLLQAEAYRQLTQSFKSEWQKWKQQVKNSRSRVEQMEAKFDAVTQQIRRAELIDPQKLFLLKQRQEAPGARRLRSRGNLRSTEGLDEELSRLETQLNRVLSEITSEYCHLSLQ